MEGLIFGILRYVLILNGTQRKLRNHLQMQNHCFMSNTFVPQTLYENLQAKKKGILKNV